MSSSRFLWVMCMPTKRGICLLLPILMLWGGIARGQSPQDISPAYLTAPATTESASTNPAPSQSPSGSDEVIKLPPLEAPLEPEKNAEPAEVVETPPPKEEKSDKAEDKAGDEKSAEQEEDSHSLLDEFDFFDITWWEVWEGSVEFGLSGTHGNTETLNFRLGTKLKHKTPYSIKTFDLTHVNKSNEGKKTAQNTLIDGRLEAPFPDSRWTYFVHGLAEFDEFRDFDMRASVDSGFGYEFIHNKHNRLVGRLGGSTSREFGTVIKRYVPELTVGLEWKMKINSRQKISAKTEYFPDVTDMNEYRLNSRASWEIVVSPDWGLSLKLSAIDRYDSTPGRAKSNDLDYSLLLLWDF